MYRVNNRVSGFGSKEASFHQFINQSNSDNRPSVDEDGVIVLHHAADDAIGTLSAMPSLFPSLLLMTTSVTACIQDVQHMVRSLLNADGERN
mgnify:CR=1 FL=1